MIFGNQNLKNLNQFYLKNFFKINKKYNNNNRIIILIKIML